MNWCEWVNEWIKISEGPIERIREMSNENVNDKVNDQMKTYK